MLIKQTSQKIAISLSLSLSIHLLLSDIHFLNYLSVSVREKETITTAATPTTQDKPKIKIKKTFPLQRANCHIGHNAIRTCIHTYGRMDKAIYVEFTVID